MPPLSAAALLDLLLERRCQGCGSGHPPLCVSCAATLAGHPSQVAPTQVVPLQEDPRGRIVPATGPAVWAACRYDGVPRALLLAWKDHGQGALAAPLGAALARAVLALDAPGRPLLLVPVPSGRAARRRRGEDHVRTLADQACGMLGRWGAQARTLPLLRPARSRADQVGLDRQARQHNMIGAFEPHPRRLSRLGRGTVVVVDDIVTTGATLGSAYEALSRAGVVVAGAAVVAATASGGRPGRVPRPGALDLPSAPTEG